MFLFDTDRAGSIAKDVGLREIVPTQESASKLICCTDLTSLEATDTRSSIKAIGEKLARLPQALRPAGLCVYPQLAATAKKILGGTAIKTISVVGFPHAQDHLQSRLEEIKQLRGLRIDEIDIVFPLGRFLDGDEDRVNHELERMVAECGGATVKIILETAELKSPEKILRASQLAISQLRSGDFIKSSTGKSPCGGASLDAVAVMSIAAERAFNENGKIIGIKPSGGIRTLSQALSFREVVKEILGEAWLEPQRIRFGASSLFHEILAFLNKSELFS